jgi:hypothetical protein
MKKSKIKAVALFIACSLLSASILVSAAACGKSESAHEHSYIKVKSVAADCENDGIDYYTCSACGDTYSQKTADALDHNFEGTAVSIRYLIPCTREGCYKGKFQAVENVYQDELAYTFTEKDEAEIEALYQSVLSAIEEIGGYQNESYEEASAIATSYEAFSALYTKLESALSQVYFQVDNAYFQYETDVEDETASENYTYINNYYETLQTNYYALYAKIADSKFKNYFYRNEDNTPWSEADLTAFLNAYSTYDEETVALKKQINDIVITSDSMDDWATSDALPALYAQFVSLGNQLATKNGYDTYLDYISEKTYFRDYTSEDLNTIVSYMKQYIVPLAKSLTEKYDALCAEFSAEQFDELDFLLNGSFFEDISINRYVNNFFNLINSYGNAIDFVQNFETLISNGLLLQTNSPWAETMPITTIGTSAILLGQEQDYETARTIVHEFGHYCEDLYSYQALYVDLSCNLSYDLGETHSQGMEALYLYYMRAELPAQVYEAFRYNSLSSYLNYVLTFLSVYEFEYAVYHNTYSGTGADVIMADNTISSDEYDALFKYILTENGVKGKSTYWRAVVIGQAGYYQTYALSLLSSLQFFVQAETTSLSTAVTNYTKLFTYADEHSDYTYFEILQYAGIASPVEESFYQKFYSALAE